uniref:Odorant binding protein OBP4 n=1 Tax=Holotrichia oblita TaxID=644536 RepID=G9BWQ8_HOLOL|nr:odorant binding protein OBP4 [Holotrichia oblita]
MTMFLYFLIVNIFLVETTQGAMTNAQIEATQRMIRRTCKSKMKITSDDELDGMLNGKWDNLSPATLCYLHCCVKMIKMVTGDGHVDYDSNVKQINNLPEPKRHPLTDSLNNCKDAGKSLTDKCEIAHEICKCFYFSNPGAYIIP